jgi:Winged helix DNA-binding domain
VSWPQALAWRLGRHLLAPLGALDAPATVRRLCGVQAQVASSADLAVRVRQADPSTVGEVAEALGDGRLIKTWAMRGTLHLLAPDEAGAFLSILAAGRLWERPSWIRAFKVSPDDWPGLRATVREALDGRVLTRDELVAAILARPEYAHLATELRSGWGTLFKPMAWQGDLVFGPSRGNRVTFTAPSSASATWAGVPAADDGARVALTSYLRAYGPADADGFSRWLARGWSPKRQLRRWFDALGERVTPVDVEGERLYVLVEDLDSLLAARSTDVVRLLPGFDQWVMGPGTDDGHVVPPERRAAVSRTAGWIAPTVVVGGVVSGTWELDRDTIRVAWFREAGRMPRKAIDAEAARLAAILGRDLDLVAETG